MPYDQIPDLPGRAVSRTLRVILTVTGPLVLPSTELQAIASFFLECTQATVIDDSRRRSHFSNSGGAHAPSRLRSIADDLGADYIHLPQHLRFHHRELFVGSRRRLARDASHRAADAIQVGFRQATIGSDGIVAIVDAGMIPIAPFEPETCLAQEPFWHLPHTSDTPEGPILYRWNDIFFVRGDPINWQEDFAWDWDVVAGVDLYTGGAITGRHSGSWFWRQDAPDFAHHLQSFLDFDAETDLGMQACESLLETFLHLWAGGNGHPGMRAQVDRRRPEFTEGLQALVAA